MGECQCWLNEREKRLKEDAVWNYVPGSESVLKRKYASLNPLHVNHPPPPAPWMEPGTAVRLGQRIVLHRDGLPLYPDSQPFEDRYTSMPPPDYSTIDAETKTLEDLMAVDMWKYVPLPNGAQTLAWESIHPRDMG